MQDALRAYIHRPDAGTQSNEARAIELAQVALARQFFPREAVAIATLTVTAGKAPLPADFGTADVIADAQGPLEFKPPREYALAMAEGVTEGLYTITGQELMLGTSAPTVTLSYYAKPGALAIGTDSNYLTASYPDVLLYRSIAEQQRFLQDWEQALTAEQYALGLTQAAAAASSVTEASGGALRMRAR